MHIKEEVREVYLCHTCMGALQVSLAMSCRVYPDIMLGVYSKAATCMRQTMYTADRNIPASQLSALPCLHVILAACLIH
jgi:hypothetical protein